MIRLSQTCKRCGFTAWILYREAQWKDSAAKGLAYSMRRHAEECTTQFLHVEETDALWRAHANLSESFYRIGTWIDARGGAWQQMVSYEQRITHVPERLADMLLARGFVRDGGAFVQVYPCGPFEVQESEVRDAGH